MYQQYFVELLDRVKRSGEYRKFRKIDRTVGNGAQVFCHELERNITLWCSNDYLGMGHHPKVVEAMMNVTEQRGCGSGGTRNISGTSADIVNLERTIAKWHEKEQGLVFTSGYIANEATLSTLYKVMPELVVFSDQHNHASMIKGMKGGRKLIFKHNDTDHLESLLQQVDYNTPKLIAFESVYSMNGAISPIVKICELAKKYNAMTFLDEVHGVGMYGSTGAGVAEQMGVQDQITIIQGTLGKAVGAMGGYISASEPIIDVIRSFAGGFIFTTSIPPSIAGAANASINHLMHSSHERDLHDRNVILTKQALDRSHINYLPNDSHIIPVVIGDPFLCKQVSDILLNDYSIFVQYINYPTVQRGTERLRITPSAVHTEQMIIELSQALSAVFEKLNINIAA